jgi:hypothetical protein
MFAHLLWRQRIRNTAPDGGKFHGLGCWWDRAEGWGDIDNLHKTRFSKHLTKDLPHGSTLSTLRFSDYFFWQARLPKNFFIVRVTTAMEAPRYSWELPVRQTGRRQTEGFQREMAQRNGFVLCYMLLKINAAANLFKSTALHPETYEFEKTLFVSQV